MGKICDECERLLTLPPKYCPQCSMFFCTTCAVYGAHSRGRYRLHLLDHVSVFPSCTASSFEKSSLSKADVEKASPPPNASSTPSSPLSTSTNASDHAVPFFRRLANQRQLTVSVSSSAPTADVTASPSHHPPCLPEALLVCSHTSVVRSDAIAPQHNVLVDPTAGNVVIGKEDILQGAPTSTLSQIGSICILQRQLHFSSLRAAVDASKDGDILSVEGRIDHEAFGLVVSKSIRIEAMGDVCSVKFERAPGTDETTPCVTLSNGKGLIVGVELVGPLSCTVLHAEEGEWTLSCCTLRCEGFDDEHCKTGKEDGCSSSTAMTYSEALVSLTGCKLYADRGLCPTPTGNHAKANVTVKDCIVCGEMVLNLGGQGQARIEGTVCALRGVANSVVVRGEGVLVLSGCSVQRRSEKKGSEEIGMLVSEGSHLQQGSVMQVECMKVAAGAVLQGCEIEANSLVLYEKSSLVDCKLQHCSTACQVSAAKGFIHMRGPGIEVRKCRLIGHTCMLPAMYLSSFPQRLTETIFESFAVGLTYELRRAMQASACFIEGNIFEGAYVIDAPLDQVPLLKTQTLPLSYLGFDKKNKHLVTPLPSFVSHGPPTFAQSH